MYFWILIRRPWSRLGKFVFGILIIIGFETAASLPAGHDFVIAARHWPHVRTVFLLLYFWFVAFSIYRLGTAGELHYPDVPAEVKAVYFENSEKKDRPDSLKTPTGYKRPARITW